MLLMLRSFGTIVRLKKRFLKTFFQEVAGGVRTGNALKNLTQKCVFNTKDRINVFTF